MCAVKDGTGCWQGLWQLGNASSGYPLSQALEHFGGKTSHRAWELVFACMFVAGGTMTVIFLALTMGRIRRAAKEKGEKEE